jgi:arylsulfatase A-like enzyme
VDHESALRIMHTGRFLAGLPSMGSWVLYGLGSENENLPAYVVLSDPGGLPVDGERNWSSGFLPALYQGTPFRSGKTPVFHLQTPAGISAEARRHQLDFITRLNRHQSERDPANSEWQARLAQFETAARMQTAVPEVMDLSGESAATRRLYGLDNPVTAEYGRRCLIARRLVERGVRFVQLFLSGQPWDTHDKNAERLKGLCAMTDQPSAALVQDLKARGLLDDTIVLWTGEFGRLPISQGKDGRDHNRHAFSLWVAGGGFKAGHVHGATDEFGYKAVEDVATIYDLHATILHLLGIDHTRLSFYNNGIERRLNDVHGHVIEPILT